MPAVTASKDHRTAALGKLLFCASLITEYKHLLPDPEGLEDFKSQAPIQLALIFKIQHYSLNPICFWSEETHLLSRQPSRPR